MEEVHWTIDETHYSDVVDLVERIVGDDLGEHPYWAAQDLVHSKVAVGVDVLVAAAVAIFVADAVVSETPLLVVVAPR